MAGKLETRRALRGSRGRQGSKGAGGGHKKGGAQELTAIHGIDPLK